MWAVILTKTHFIFLNQKIITTDHKHVTQPKYDHMQKISKQKLFLWVNQIWKILSFRVTPTRSTFKRTVVLDSWFFRIGSATSAVLSSIIYNEIQNYWSITKGMKYTAWNKKMISLMLEHSWNPSSYANHIVGSLFTTKFYPTSNFFLLWNSCSYL